MNRSPTTVALVGLIACLFSIVSTAGEADDVAMELPTEMCRGYFFVPLELAPREGYPEDRTLWFLHDTGASSSYVDPDSIERVAGIRPKRSSRVNMRDVTIGPLKYKRVTARVSELDHLSVALGRRIDGILSFGAFRDFLLTLDYQEGMIRLEKGELPKPNGVDVFSSKGRDSRPWTNVKFAKRTRRMLIDSGAGRSSLVIRRLDKYQTVSPPRVVGAITGLRSDDIELRTSARAAQPVLIGSHSLNETMLSSTKDTELIGGDVMRHFDWTFDQSNKRFRMTRNEPDARMDFAAASGLGLLYIPTAEGLLVRRILEGAPARHVDIRPGDLVTQIDGQPLVERGCETKDEGDVTIGFLRDGQFREVTVGIYTLVP